MRKTYVTPYFTGNAITAYLVCEDGTGRTIKKFTDDKYFDGVAKIAADNYVEGWNAAMTRCETPEGLEKLFHDPVPAASTAHETHESDRPKASNFFNIPALYGAGFAAIVIMAALIFKESMK